MSGESQAYELPAHLGLNHWALSGRWTIEPEDAALDEAGGAVAFRFSARDAHLVLSSRGGDPGAQLAQRLDGDPHLERADGRTAAVRGAARCRDRGAGRGGLGGNGHHGSSGKGQPNVNT